MVGRLVSHGFLFERHPYIALLSEYVRGYRKFPVDASILSAHKLPSRGYIIVVVVVLRPTQPLPLFGLPDMLTAGATTLIIFLPAFRGEILADLVSASSSTGTSSRKDSAMGQCTAIG
jgi:hypothetical protein